MEEYLIRVEDLTKKFGEKVVFHNVNIEFRKGESIAILGNNGMGKSTFLKMISGLTSLSGGKVITSKKIKFSYIPENFSKLNLTIEEYLKSMGELDKIGKDEFRVKVNELYKKFYLESMIDIPMKHLSKGSLQKVAVVQALISKTDVLLLDEPLSGLDINSQRNFIFTIKELIKDGITVIMSCHEPFLVNELSAKVLKIKDKKIVEGGKPKAEKVIYNTITFEKRDKDISKFFLKFKDNIESYEEDGLLYLKVEESIGQEVLVDMLNDGYKLKYFN